MPLLFLDGFEDFDLSHQGHLYYNVPQLSDPYGLVSRSGRGTQGGAGLTLMSQEQTLTMGYAYMTEELDAGFFPFMNFANVPARNYFGFAGYNDRATATAFVGGDGSITVSITHGGSYYTKPPKVTIVNQLGEHGTYDHVVTAVGDPMDDANKGKVISIAVVGSTGYNLAKPPLVVIALGGLGLQARSTLEFSIVLGSPSAKALSAGEWNYLEFSATTYPEFDTFTGKWYSLFVYTLKVNGEVWLNNVLATAEVGEAQSVFSYVEFQSNRGIIDDLYVTDGEFLCDGLFTNGNQGIRVLTLFPNGQGAHQDFTPSDSTKQNWQMVKERFPDYDASYVSINAAMGLDEFSDPVALEDTYTLQPLPTAREIRGIQANWIAKKTKAGPCTFQGLRSDSTDILGQVSVLGQWNPSYASYSAFYKPMRFKNLDTEWTVQQINDMELGQRKV